MEQRALTVDESGHVDVFAETLPLIRASPVGLAKERWLGNSTNTSDRKDAMVWQLSGSAG